MIWKLVTSVTNAVITAIRRNFRSWTTSLYGWALICYSGWVVWQVLSQTKLHLRQQDSTLIYLDLLQVMAFLVAWSALVITVTVKMVNAKRDIEMDAAKLDWTLTLHNERQRENERKYEEHLRDHPDIEGKVASLEIRTKDMLGEVDEAKEVARQLRGENQLLRQKLSEAGIPY